MKKLSRFPSHYSSYMVLLSLYYLVTILVLQQVLPVDGNNINNKNNNGNNNEKSSSWSKDEKKAFEALRKAVMDHDGGYVHPSLGLMAPAPTSGADRGIGMIRNVKQQQDDNDNDNGGMTLIKVPLSYQMTRDLALSTLTPLFFQQKQTLSSSPPPPLDDFDDAALLVLLLAHELGLGKDSKFYAYLQTLVTTDMTSVGCGWASEAATTDFRKLPSDKLVDPDDVEMAIHYAHRVSNGMAQDYGRFLANKFWPKQWNNDPSQALLWSLCTVNSRATAANRIPGDDTSGVGVRLIPLADLANHEFIAGGYTELSSSLSPSSSSIATGIASSEQDIGAFLVRSIWRDGTKRVLEKGDEITVNYNLPYYGPVDWYLSLGFIPPELSATAASDMSNNEL